MILRDVVFEEVVLYMGEFLTPSAKSKDCFGCNTFCKWLFLVVTINTYKTKEAQLTNHSGLTVAITSIFDFLALDSMQTGFFELHITCEWRNLKKRLTKTFLLPFFSTNYYQFLHPLCHFSH